MGERQNEMCEFCEKEVESAEHILKTCSRLMGPRRKGLRKSILENEDIGRLRIKDIAEFARDVDKIRPEEEKDEEEKQW
ncbi:hypothetical protein WN55_09005 [Dufourea novaeangliae]|uniref:Uncharacterized protein n=1 Tax=Dufourea novaeangliae TaxID=178035 RepID=A0A154P612_DUFNO|nr:hypothetical protein WN55_09005 [Dufourea novaeangliae]